MTRVGMTRTCRRVKLGSTHEVEGSRGLVRCDTHSHASGDTSAKEEQLL